MRGWSRGKTKEVLAECRAPPEVAEFFLSVDLCMFTGDLPKTFSSEYYRAPSLGMASIPHSVFNHV